MAKAQQLYTLNVVNYVAMMTAEILSTTNYTTADQIGVCADGVPDLVLPWALELERLEKGVLQRHPDLFDYSQGVFAYEIVEALAHKWLADPFAKPEQIKAAALECFLTDTYWCELPEEIIATAREVSAASSTTTTN